MPETRWTRVESLFHEALPMSAEQREKFLAEACQGDSVLYAEIASLLSSYRLEDELLEKMGVPPLASALESVAPMFVPGERLGAYEIIGMLGKGGMGEVYLARDLNLGRKVALKILPRGVAGRPLLIERLRREAQAASALNHPNILTIYDFGQQDDVQYMVSEFVEGASLREYIGKLSTAEALDYARQIGEALKAAHAVGIIHRDIKPENIMVRSDGYIKVLDFGLAKLAEPRAESGQSLYQRLADSSASTVPGLLVGTINYMSPEQVRGQAIDQRTDVWGWGVVLYEMLAGVRPFEASTPGDTLAAILNREPVPPGNIGKLNRIVARALAKQLEKRYQNISGPLEDLAQIEGRRPPQRGRTLIYSLAGFVRARKKLLSVAAVLILLSGTVAFWAYQRTVNTPLHVESIVPLTTSGNLRKTAISPDEKFVAYTTQESDGQAIWIQETDPKSGPKQIHRTTAQYSGITFSPNGQSLYYVLQQGGIGKLYNFPLPAGPPKLAREYVDSAISFSPDGTRFAFLRIDGQTHQSHLIVAGLQVSSESTEWTSSAPVYLGDPIWSPDGCCLLFPVLDDSSAEATNIRLMSLNLKTRQIQQTSPPWYWVGRPLWSRDGRRVLIPATDNNSNGGKLWEISWPDGKISPVLPNTVSDLDSGKDQRNFVTVEYIRHSTPWVVSLEGPMATREVPQLHGKFFGLAWTKSGQLISQSDFGGQPDLWTIDPGTGEVHAITHDASMEQDAVASPDGRYLVYASNRQGTSQLWRSNPDGSSPVRLTADTSREQQPAFTPDGKSVIFTSIRSGTFGLWKVSIDGGAPVQVTNRTARRASVSPNGAFILCELYVDQGGGGWQTAVLDGVGNLVRYFPNIQTGERSHAIWSGDGNGILYAATQNGISNLWEQPFHGGSPKQLTHFTNEKIYAFALSPDGHSLACLRGTEAWNAVLVRMAR